MRWYPHADLDAATWAALDKDPHHAVVAWEDRVRETLLHAISDILWSAGFTTAFTPAGTEEDGTESGPIVLGGPAPRVTVCQLSVTSQVDPIDGRAAVSAFRSASGSPQLPRVMAVLPDNEPSKVITEPGLPISRHPGSRESAGGEEEGSQARAGAAPRR